MALHVTMHQYSIRAKTNKGVAAQCLQVVTRASCKQHCNVLIHLATYQPTLAVKHALYVVLSSNTLDAMPGAFL